MDDLKPQVKRFLGNYEIKQTLGYGSSGKVKLAVHTQTGASVALKLIKTSNRASLKKMAAIENEIKVMKLLCHDNIVNLLDFDLEARYPKKSGGFSEMVLLVLEYAGGHELFDYIMHTGAMSEPQARSYFKSLISAMEYLHNEGVCHRDLKPENLLLDNEFQLKVADFGLSSSWDVDNSCKEPFLETACGTRGYLAPEIHSRGNYKGSSADIWSAGVILFVMVAGHPPFEVARSPDWWFNCVNQNRYDKFWAAHFRSMPAISPELQDLLSNIFVVNPGERASIEQIKSHAWFQLETLDSSILMEQMGDRKRALEAKKYAELEAAKALNQRKKGLMVKPFHGDTCRSTPLIQDSPLGYDLIYTPFSSSFMFERFVDIIEEISGQVYMKKLSSLKIKAIFGSSSNVSEAIHVKVKLLDVEGICGINLCRTNGDIFEFKKIKSKLEDKLKVLYLTTDEDEEETLSDVVDLI